MLTKPTSIAGFEAEQLLIEREMHTPIPVEELYEPLPDRKGYSDLLTSCLFLAAWLTLVTASGSSPQAFLAANPWWGGAEWVIGISAVVGIVRGVILMRGDE